MKKPGSTALLLSVCAALLASLYADTFAGEIDGDGQNTREEQSYKQAPRVHAPARHKFMFRTDIRPNLDSIAHPVLQDLTPPDISINPENIAGISAPPILGAAPVQPMPPALGPSAPPVGDSLWTPPTEMQLHDPRYLLLYLIAQPGVKPIIDKFPELFQNAPTAQMRERAGQILWEVNVTAFKKALQEKDIIRKIHGKEELKFTEEDCIKDHDRFSEIFKDTVREDTDARSKRNERETMEWAHVVELVDSWLEYDMGLTPFAGKAPKLLTAMQQEARGLIQALRNGNTKDHLWSYEAWQLLHHRRAFFLQEYAKLKDRDKFLLVWEWPKNLGNAVCHAYLEAARNEYPPDSDSSLSANK